ncbi:hypothetical protein LguiA_032074 [Lonicera macranthoides]
MCIHTTYHLDLADLQQNRRRRKNIFNVSGYVWKYKSIKVLEYILGVPGLVINECSRTDDVTALDCAYFYESRNSAKAHSRLIDHGAVHVTTRTALSVFWPNKYAEFCDLGMWCERVECIKAHNILEFGGRVIDSDLHFSPLPGHWTLVAPIAIRGKIPQPHS